ncbi:MAG: cytochrome c maturation protein CcmE [Sphaerobacter sp.]|nr:cytochrome c maturation protein CcmE [Sphaerobacter sp.]
MTGGAVPKPAAASRRAPWLNTKILVAGIVLVCAVGFLIYNSLQGNAAAYFVTVGELQAQADKVDGTRVRVGGDVEPGSIQMGGPGEPIRFVITDGTHTMPVVYQGVAPDIFSDHVQVIVEGTFRAGGEFHADTLLTKCPSRFTATQEAGV